MHFCRAQINVSVSQFTFVIFKALKDSLKTFEIRATGFDKFGLVSWFTANAASGRMHVLM